MGFLWPAAGFLLLFGLVPVLFYLFRQHPRLRPVSTLLFWESLEEVREETRWWQKLRRWLSMLLQIVLVLLLVGALSRPIWPGDGTDHGAVLLVLDNSPGMGGRGEGLSPWERALAEADRQLGQLRSNQEVLILLTSPAPEVLLEWSNHPRRGRRALEAATLAASPADWPTTLRLVGNLAKSRERVQVVVLSDLVWDFWPEDQWGKDWALFPMQSESVDHAGLVRFGVRRSLVHPGEYHLEAEAAYEGAQPFEGEALLYQNGNLSDLQAVTMDPGGSWTHRWTGLREEGAEFRLVLERLNGNGSRLGVDQEAVLVLPPFPEVEIHLFGEENPFLEAVWRAQPRVKYQFHGYDESGSGGSEDAVPTLMVYHRTLPPEPERSPSRPTLLLDAPGDGFWGTGGGYRDHPAALAQADEHLLLQHLDLGMLRLRGAREWTPPVDAEVFLQGELIPLLYGRWDYRSRWLHMPFSLRESDLALRAAFPILAGNLIQSLRPGNQPTAAVLPGETTTRGRALTPPEDVVRVGTINAPGWWSRYPLWVFLLLLAVAWSFVEWRTFTRRHTE